MKVRGFTLIELIITLLIGSLLLAWGVPNYRDFKHRREVVDNANEFVYSLNLARAEAVRYGTDVNIVPVSNDWNLGWTITAEGVGGSSDTIIQEHDPVNNMDIDLTTNPGNGITFNRIGGLQGNAIAMFSLVHQGDSSQSRNIRVGMSGTVKVIQP
jgi:type IV fimbrial biogenesis protein FimT